MPLSSRSTMPGPGRLEISEVGARAPQTSLASQDATWASPRLPAVLSGPSTRSSSPSVREAQAQKMKLPHLMSTLRSGREGDAPTATTRQQRMSEGAMSFIGSLRVAPMGHCQLQPCIRAWMQSRQLSSLGLSSARSEGLLLPMCSFRFICSWFHFWCRQCANVWLQIHMFMIPFMVQALCICIH